MTFRALERAHQQATLLSDREHVTPWLRRNLPAYRWASMGCAADLSYLRWCVDTEADLHVVREIYRLMGHDDFRTEDVLELLRLYPELTTINASERRNEGYLRSLKGDCYGSGR